MHKVAIIGGGLAGLSVAHHLARWNRAHPTDESKQFEITVFDPRGYDWEALGGKCRSWRVDASSDPSVSKDFVDGLTGEHGFRFFPGFYRRVVDTMAQIPIDGASHDPGFADSVASRLVPLPKAVFYAERLEPTNPSWQANAAAKAASKVASVLGYFLGVLWVTSLVVAFSYGWLPSWGIFFWLAAIVGWKMLRWALESAALDVGAELAINLPMGPGGAKASADPEVQAELQAAVDAGKADRSRLIGRFFAPIALLLPAAVAAIIWTSPGWLMYAAAALMLLALLFSRILLAVYWFWSTMRGSVPFDVRPRSLESLYASLMVLQIIVSSRIRMERLWENTSWWAYIGAPKLSGRYRLVLATGLTRTFVATRAERMSTRTGGGILAQLLYDINPFLNTGHAADRVLDGPTSEAWIQPWVDYLANSGVKFNEIPPGQGIVTPTAPEGHVLVQELTVDEQANRISGFEATTKTTVPRNRPDPLDAFQRTYDISVKAEFDSFVLAAGTNAARRILGNSLDLTRHDRRLDSKARGTAAMTGDKPIPYLDGIFQLELGWMSGVVFHSLSPADDVEVPLGHLLLLESPWALTAVNQQPFWSPGYGIPNKWRLLSVNVSDWFTPSAQGAPARFVSEQQVGESTWKQFRSHVGSITATPPKPLLVVNDEAVADEDPNSLLARVGLQPRPLAAAKMENLPLTNRDQLMINTARSWENRPTATTTIENLYIAGDHVRTYADFASMESADESARWAVRGLLGKHHDISAPGVIDAVPAEPDPLRTPKYISWLVTPFKAIDHLLMRARLPNPIGLAAIPVGWFAGVEHILRSAWERPFRPSGLPARW